MAKVVKISIYDSADEHCTACQQNRKKPENFFLEYYFVTTLDKFKEQIFIRMPELRNKSLKIYYEDHYYKHDDKDLKDITIFNDADWQRFVNDGFEHVCVSIRKDVSSLEGATAKQFHHPDIVCDVCDKYIYGKRYRCLECDNFDLCMDCEAKMEHRQHFMIRLAAQNQNVEPKPVGTPNVNSTTYATKYGDCIGFCLKKINYISSLLATIYGDLAYIASGKASTSTISTATMTTADKSKEIENKQPIAATEAKPIGISKGTRKSYAMKLRPRPRPADVSKITYCSDNDEEGYEGIRNMVVESNGFQQHITANNGKAQQNNFFIPSDTCYKSLQDRKESGEAAWRAPSWDECVAYTVPLIREMHCRILKPTEFSPTQ